MPIVLGTRVHGGLLSYGAIPCRSSLIRKAVVLAAAALIPPLAFAIPAFLSHGAKFGAWLFTTVAAFSVPITVIGALPIIVVLSLLKLRKLGHYIFGGIVLGLAIFGVFFGPNMVGNFTVGGLPAFVAQAMLPAVLCAVCAAVYWLFVRPDRD